MRIPELNIGGDFDYDLVSHAGSIRKNPVVQIVERDHKRISANPAGGWGILIAVRHEFGRSILRRHIVHDIGRKVV